MTLGWAALMLQEAVESVREKKAGVGVGICFQCQDALAIYREAASRGLRTLREPQIPTVTGLISPAPPICRQRRSCRRSVQRE